MINLLKNITNLFHKKKKVIEGELAVKTTVNKVVARFIKEEVLKNTEIEYKLSHTLNKGIIKLEIDNKLIAQEIALRIRTLESRLKNEGVTFKKLLI